MPLCFRAHSRIHTCTDIDIDLPGCRSSDFRCEGRTMWAIVTCVLGQREGSSRLGCPAVVLGVDVMMGHG